MQFAINCIFFVTGFLAMSSKGDHNGLGSLIEEYALKTIKFDYASEQEKEADIHSGVLKEDSAIPISVNVDYYHTLSKRRVLVSLPRLKEGIPATFGSIIQKNETHVIAPYPDWTWHRDPQLCKKNRLISVFRTKIDKCGRLWVLDTGKIGEKFVCPPQILAFDLRMDTVIHQMNLPSNVYTDKSVFVTPVVEVKDPENGCKQTFIYMADYLGNIIVHDVAKSDFWKVHHKSMESVPEWYIFRIGDDVVNMTDGLLGMALEPNKPGYDRRLFYHALASNTETTVKTSYLQNKELFINDPDSSPQIFNTLKSTRPSQSAAENIDSHGVMYFGLLSEIAIACWNTKNSQYRKKIEIIAKNKEKLQFPSGVMVTKKQDGMEELWILTSRFQKFRLGTMNNSDYNYRIFSSPINKINGGNHCLPPRQ